MVEGPLVHFVAVTHRRLLLGQRLLASSPNGKFRDGAALVDGQVLTLIEAHGKNIFYFFTHSKPANSKQMVPKHLPEDTTVVHIHFGLSGSFKTYAAPGPEPRPTTRLRLAAEKVGLVANCSANVCNHGNLELYRKKVECLGPDPLRKDGDKERLWTSLQNSKKKIGAVLMDQSLVAGIGNIYRTELLFITGVHPDQPASSLTRSTFEQLWSEAQRLFQVGVITGSLITVSPDEASFRFRSRNQEKQLPRRGGQPPKASRNQVNQEESHPADSNPSLSLHDNKEISISSPSYSPDDSSSTHTTISKRSKKHNEKPSSPKKNDTATTGKPKLTAISKKSKIDMKRSGSKQTFKSRYKDLKFDNYNGRRDVNKVLSFIRQFEAAFANGNFKEKSKLCHVGMYLKETASNWWLTKILEGTQAKTWKQFNTNKTLKKPDFESRERERIDTRLGTRRWAGLPP
ncbi:hypothetical protein L7F22_062274 [Adiantum nelumboides]|nr:hypothetical protein [Adiantum nelumboides]